MPEQQRLTEEQLREHSGQMIGELGQMLGLDPEFVAAVAADGQSAVIDRAEMVDATGGQARLLRMTQQFGIFLQKQAGARADMRPGVLLPAMEGIAKYNDVDEDLGVMLLASILEVFQQSMRRLKRVKTDASENTTGV